MHGNSFPSFRVEASLEPVWVACAMTEGDRLRAELAARQGEVLISPPGPRPEKSEGCRLSSPVSEARVGGPASGRTSGR